MHFHDVLEFDTKLTADVVEWQPTNNKIENSDLLACGTYYLDKEKNQRQGCLYLLQININEKSYDIIKTLNYDSSGILDLKWINNNYLITIDSKNELKLLNYQKEPNLFGPTVSIKLAENSIGLTLDYMKLDENSYKVVSTDTFGNLNIISINNNNLILEKEFKAHDYEVWSTLIDKNDPNIIYSGADDCLLRMWDVRQSDHKKANECSLFEGGVCSIILPQRYDQHQTLLPGYSTNNLICGSYDERIYVLDKRNMKRSVKQSKKLNGGVWKIKLHTNKNMLLCACMHTGLHIVETDNDLETQLYYDGHGLNNLAYGCDWHPLGTDHRDTIASCSFYNHNLRIWNVLY